MNDEQRSLKRVLLVGCPRSGTSWLQLLLAQHPAVATTQETHLFAVYLAHIEEVWQRHLRWRAGMTQLYSEDEFYDLWKSLADDVFRRIAATSPSASVVLEKTPAHVRFGRMIMRLCPDAYFIHMVRDPRAVVSSLCAAGRSWGSDWASSKAAVNAQRWHADVSAGHQLANLTSRLREARYEELRSERGARALQAIYEWLELPVDLAFCEQALENCRIDRLREGGRDLRAFAALRRQDSFYRRGSVDSWRTDLSRRQIRIVEYINGDLMKLYGYRPISGSYRRRPLTLTFARWSANLRWWRKKALRLMSMKLRPATQG